MREELERDKGGAVRYSKCSEDRGRQREKQRYKDSERI